MTEKKIALITGVTGQDGSYLAELLLEKNYDVHGVIRRSSNVNTARIEHLYQSPQEKDKCFFLHYGDVTDFGGISNLVNKIKPDEVYNLAAQSHVGISFDLPSYTANVDALGTLNVLEAIKQNNLEDHSKFYQASTSELYGKVQEIPQKETTPFYPRSPYGVAKLYSYWITVNYRESYGMYACNGILFNHESPRRGLNFITRKVTYTAARIFHNLDKCLYIGNLDAERDWGHAKDYVKMQWMMLQQEIPEDYVIATGKKFSVRFLIEKVFESMGIEIEWSGNGVDEKGIVSKVDDNAPNHIEPGHILVKIDPRYFRPAEVELLIGDSSKAKDQLGWEPEISFDEMINEMLEHDITLFNQG